MAFPLSDIPYLFVALAVAFSIHEFAHAFVAYKFGDPTAKKQGRLTLSPIAHLDIFGTLMIFLAGFGWAKPVPVNRLYFKKPRVAGFFVSVVGPISNLLLAIVSFIVWYTLISLQFANGTTTYLDHFFELFILLNIILFVFNLLPFPPLDGYRMIEDLVSPGFRSKMTRYEHYGIIIFLILVLTPLDQYTITPIFDTLVPFVASTLNELTSIFF